MQRRAAQVESLLTEIHSLKKEVKKVKTLTELKLKEFERDLQTPTTYRTLPLEIKVPISLGHNKEWYSSTFYSHDRGYRMQLIVNDTIPWERCITFFFTDIMHCDRAKHRQYLGVHVQILPGEFDNSLQWPTLFKLTVRLLHPKLTFQPDTSIRAELRPTPHYSVERHLNLNGRHTSLIWTYSQVGRKCCFHNQLATLHAQRSRCTACVRRWRRL